jgi:hypothetical protein
MDKLSQSEKSQRKRSIQMQSGISALFPVSSLKKQGFATVEEFIFSDWVEPYLKQSPDYIPEEEDALGDDIDEDERTWGEEE